MLMLLLLLNVVQNLLINYFLICPIPYILLSYFVLFYLYFIYDKVTVIWTFYCRNNNVRKHVYGNS